MGFFLKKIPFLGISKMSVGPIPNRDLPKIKQHIIPSQTRNDVLLSHIDLFELRLSAPFICL